MTTSLPYVVMSAAMSVDGYIDDASDRRLVLSDAADLDRVDELRASVDAILVGAGTIRADNPRLLVRSEGRRAARRRQGLAGSPRKVTLTTSGDLDPGAAFFTAGDVEKLVYCPLDAGEKVAARLGGRARVIGLGDRLRPGAVLTDLQRRGVRRLLVEGGSHVQAEFLVAGLVDELLLAVAPLFVGDPAAPRFASGAGLPAERVGLGRIDRVGDMVVATYHPPTRAELDRRWMGRAVELSRSCPPSPGAYSVGAILVDERGREVARGYSRESGPADHAEEAALAKVSPGDPRLRGATLYSTLEPCSERRSRPVTCTRHVLDAGIARVVVAWREPSLFVDDCRGVETLAAAGVEVVELPELAADARAVNAHLGLGG